MEFNLADLFERVAETVPEREALVCVGSETTKRSSGGDVRWSYEELLARTNQMAHLLLASGVRPGDRVGVHLHNGWPYVVAMMGCFSVRAIPVNVNYRYTAPELAYLFGDADLVAVITESENRTLLEKAIAAWGGESEVLIAGGAFADDLAAFPSVRPPVGARSADDRYLLYTGGTTGAPKGVVWRHEDIYFASLGGRGTPSAGVAPVTAPEQVAARARDGGPIMRRLPLCPMMHGGAMWIALQSHLSGGALVLSTDRTFRADTALRLLADERVDLTMLIGDATARPIAAELRSAPPGTYELGHLQVIASGGAVLSPDTKASLCASLPGVKVVDTFGASETGGQGRLRRSDGGPPVLLTDADTAVFDDEDRPVLPGSGVVGRLARTGNIPLGYWRDEAKSAVTFPVIDGKRWSVPGDLALVESDGAVRLLGRGSSCINTGGEKVYAEEVEAAIKADARVADALVVGLPDERFGQRVVAVLAFHHDDVEEAPGDQELGAAVRTQLAGYKVPKTWVRVPAVRRLVTGKPDYAWAVEVAAAEAVWDDLPADRRLPHPDRLSPHSELYERAMRAHDAAVGHGDLGYLDPLTGLYVMTARTLWKREGCCVSGCRHCPYLAR